MTKPVISVIVDGGRFQVLVPDGVDGDMTLWQKLKSSVGFAEPSKPIIEELAASTGDGRDITRGYIPANTPILPQDRILSARGGDYAVYKEVFSDWQVKTALQQRQMAFISREWQVIPGGKRAVDKSAAAFMEEIIDHIQWDSTSMMMWHGLFYGHSIGECLWDHDSRYVTLDSVRVRDRLRFVYDAEQRLRLLTITNPNGELLPDKKFWTFRTGADHDDEPYGLGLAHWLFWPVVFKKQNIKFWLIGIEKHASPTAAGFFPPNATASEKEKLLSALRAIQQDAGVIFPEGIRVELLEATRSGAAEYSDLCTYMDAAISKVIVGQTMTTEATAGQYKAEVQQDVMLSLAASDADLICASFNSGPVKWLTEWNFPNAIPPKVWRETEEPEDLTARAARDKSIFDMGFRPSVQYIHDTYGGEWQEIQPPTATTSAQDADDDDDESPQFAEGDRPPPDQAALDAAMNALSADDLSSAGRALVKPLIDLMEREGAAAALGAIADRFPDDDDDVLNGKLAQALFVAETWGRLSAHAEAESDAR